MGSIPSTSIAKLGFLLADGLAHPSRHKLRSTPAPATTNTMVSGPSWVTAPRAAPAPEMSAAPKEASKVLSVKTISTVSGIETAIVGNSATLVMNQLWKMHSRQ